MDTVHTARTASKTGPNNRPAGALDLVDRPLPHDIKAEQAVIGSMMLDNSTIPVAAALLTPQSYYRQSHQRLHAAIADMHAAGTAVDPVTLYDELRRRGQLDDPSQGELTVEYVAEVFESTPTAANAEYYARIVRQNWLRRRRALLGMRLIREAHDPTDCADAMDEIADELAELRDSRSRPDGCAAVWDDEIISRPAPRYLVDGLLVDRSHAMLSAPEGAGKSLLALGIAQSVAAGVPWLGRAVRQGLVVYVAGEGIGGLPIRVRAWRQHHGHESRAGVLYHLGPVQLADTGDVGQLIRRTRTQPAAPALVVVDTLARCAVGLDECTTQDMGQVIVGCDRIIGETGATLLLIHHDARGTGRARGSTALAAGMDTILSLSADRGALTLRVAKQRDGALLPPVALRLERVLLSETESSCVVVEDHDRNGHQRADHDDDIQARVTHVLRQFPEGQTLRIVAETVALSNTRVRPILDALCARGEVEPCEITKRSGRGERTYGGYRIRA